MPDVSVAVNVTPAGIPVVGVLLMLGLFAFFVWDALRLPVNAWFRWLMPVGLVPFLIGANFSIIWLMVIGVVVMAVGFGMTKSWRQSRKVKGF
ncbi:hypothetical protein [Streptomyces sp. NPDC047990]|uniref:hypothetical protein n=1 Tax=Streptomyces sp. NPDC047990 TaxID=3365496 RepID=UPI0037221A74